MRRLTEEENHSIANDAVQGVREEVLVGLLNSFRKATLYAIADLNHIEADETMTRRQLVRRIVAGLA